MVLLPLLFPTIPIDTAKAAWAAVGKKNFYMEVGDQANLLFAGIHLSYPEHQILKSPHTQAVIYLVTIFQYIETLPDLLAAKSLKEQVGWKYALHLPMNHPGIEAETLHDFRKWLAVDVDARNNLKILIERLSKITDCPAQLAVCPDASLVISEVCQTSCIANMWEAIAEVMDALGISRSERILGVHLPLWYMRYSDLQNNIKLGKDRLERHALIHKIGADGYYLLKALSDSDVPGITDLPEILNLKQICEELYEQAEGKVRWKREVCMCCTQ